MVKPKEISEEKIAAASYVLAFYKDVKLLTHNQSNYRDFILELASKYAPKDKDVDEAMPMGNDEKQALLNNAKAARYYVDQTYIAYSTILKRLKKDVPDDIKKLHDDLMDQFMPKRKELFDFTMKMNYFLGEQIMQDLLRSSNEFVNQVYGQEEQKDTGSK